MTLLPLFRVTYVWEDGRDNQVDRSEEIRAEDAQTALGYLLDDDEDMNFTFMIQPTGRVVFHARPEDEEPEEGWPSPWSYDHAGGITEARDCTEYYWGCFHVEGPLTKKQCECCGGTGEVDA